MERHVVDPFDGWMTALERRHLARLTFQEVRRALVALSSIYVERRSRIGRGGAFDGAGKRAAFALFYGPLHFLLVRKIVRALAAAEPPPSRVLDLGCGTGAAGAAWSLAAGGSPPIAAIDRHAWAIEEAAWTLRALGLRGHARRADLERTPFHGSGEAILLSFAVNELAPQARERLLARLLEAARRGARILVVEPLARRPIPWWGEWSAAFAAAEGRDDEWRFPVTLPDRLRLLDHAAGMDHHELTGRSLWIA